MAEPSGDIHFRKVMGITRKEFLRNLSAAFAAQTYQVATNEIVVSDDARRINITLCEQAEQRLGSLRLPKLLVKLTLTGYSDREAQALMRHLDTHFRRGGG